MLDLTDTISFTFMHLIVAIIIWVLCWIEHFSRSFYMSILSPGCLSIWVLTNKSRRPLLMTHFSRLYCVEAVKLAKSAQTELRICVQYTWSINSYGHPSKKLVRTVLNLNMSSSVSAGSSSDSSACSKISTGQSSNSKKHGLTISIIIAFVLSVCINSQLALCTPYVSAWLLMRNLRAMNKSSDFVFQQRRMTL